MLSAQFLRSLADRDDIEGQLAALALDELEAGFVLLESGTVVYRDDAMRRLCELRGIYGPQLPPAPPSAPSAPSADSGCSSTDRFGLDRLCVGSWAHPTVYGED